MKRRYAVLSFKIKLAILDEFINFQQNPPIIEGKPQSLNGFCQSLVDNISSKLSTVKR